MDDTDSTEFIFNFIRTYENLNIVQDKVGLFVDVKPLVEESTVFYFKSLFRYYFFKMKLLVKFFKYMFNFKIQKNWKQEWDAYFKEKLNKDLYEVKMYIFFQWADKDHAKWKLKTLFNNFMVFKNYPLNSFKLKIHNKVWPISSYSNGKAPLRKFVFTAHELSSIFHFPNNPKNETSLLKVTSKKLALPIWVPTFEYETHKNGEIIPKGTPDNINIIWISDYRSTRVPVWVYDEDRLRHMYVVWKTGVWKSKFLSNLMVSDIQNGRGFWVIDPHWDLIEEIMNHIPEERKDDVIIFDPMDTEYPFCLNPLDVRENESKQILAKGFIDIFKKFFWANWNPKLEHVLRMIFLALLDKPNSTLFDLIRALTDKDFRYDMIESIGDDVVRNFWTNEFAWWSQQFNSEAIMPILNKVWQLLSIDVLKNIFASTENKLDFRDMMDKQKIIFVKLPKWKLQEEIMWFLGAMFITKIFQTAMWRQWSSKSDRKPFYLYVDEFQNFATDTFSEILSEARKYGLGLTIANQYIKQIPPNISEAIFWNVWTLMSFRISSEDALYMKQHFEPFLDAYDLANLNVREFYAKMIVEGAVKDPFSLRTAFLPDHDLRIDFITWLYELSRQKYSRSLMEAKQEAEEKQKDVLDKIEEFVEPII